MNWAGPVAEKHSKDAFFDVPAHWLPRWDEPNLINLDQEGEWWEEGLQSIMSRSKYMEVQVDYGNGPIRFSTSMRRSFRGAALRLSKVSVLSGPYAQAVEPVLVVPWRTLVTGHMISLSGRGVEGLGWDIPTEAITTSDDFEEIFTALSKREVERRFWEVITTSDEFEEVFSA